MSRKERQKAAPSAESPRQEHVHHEIFTAKRLLIMFGLLEILIVILMFYSSHGRWHMNRAKAAANRRDFQTAFKHYKWLEEKTPAAKSASFNLEMGNVCLALGRHDEAIRYYQELIKKSGAQKGSYSLLGSAYLLKGDKESARASFLREMENNPLDPIANFQLGDLSFKEKKYQEATAYFSRVAYLPDYRNRLKPYWDTIEKEVLSR